MTTAPLAIIGLGYVGLPLAISFAEVGYKVFGFDDVKAAYSHMASGAHFGKIVIRVA